MRPHRSKIPATMFGSMTQLTVLNQPPFTTQRVISSDTTEKVRLAMNVVRSKNVSLIAILVRDYSES